jgi:hypothetical protein
MTAHATRDTVEELERAFSDQAPFACAVALGELLEAEAAGLIPAASWRDGIDVKQLEQYLTRERTAIEARFERDREYVRRLLGERLIFEEALQMLTLRSSLESAARWVEDGLVPPLSAQDPSLAETLRLNADSVASARARPTLGLTPKLPAHWWWRSDEPPEEQPQ